MAGRNAVHRATAIRQAHAALARLAVAPDALDDPLVVVAYDDLLAEGVNVDVLPLLDYRMGLTLGHGRENPRRYRWGLSHRAEPGSAVYESPRHAAPVNWRPLEAERLATDPSGYGRRLMEPITLAAQFGFWGRIAASADDGPERPGPTSVAHAPQVAVRAAAFLKEAVPTAEHDLAAWFAGMDPWRDTFALWLLTDEPHAVERLRDLIFSLAIRYGGLAVRGGGIVRGIRYPFHDQQLVSASAQLALGLWRCGVYPTTIPTLVEFVAESRSAAGGWGDPGQGEDVLTTLAAAELLSRLDPGFDPGATVDWLVGRQEPGGWWRALNPEVPWLTHAIARWLEDSDRPFPDRFAWPSAPIWSRDRLTGLRTIASLDELETVFAGLPPLGALEIEAAFLDLAGFGAFNTRAGQVEGDEVLALLGASLLGLADVLPTRLGGDEFLILSKPGAPRGSLAQRLDPWRREWADVIGRRIDGGAVAPRIVWGRSNASELRTLRRLLGEAIGALKADFPKPIPDGVIRGIDA